MGSVHSLTQAGLWLTWAEQARNAQDAASLELAEELQTEEGESVGVAVESASWERVKRGKSRVVEEETAPRVRGVARGTHIDTSSKKIY